MKKVKDKKRKILFVITQSEMGGAQRFLLAYSDWLSQRGWEVIIASGKDKSKVKSQKSKVQVKSLKLKNLKRGPNPFRAVMAIKEIHKLIKEEKPDVLFLCSTMAGLLGSVAGRISGHRTSKGTPMSLQTIYRIGGWAFNDPRPWWQKKIIIILERLTARFKNKIIVNSQYDLETALKHKIAPAEKLIKIYNGLEPTSMKFLSREEAREKIESMLKNRTSEGTPISGAILGNPISGGNRISGTDRISGSNPVLIGTIANFYKTKGLEYLIKSSSLLVYKLQITNYKLLIVGGGKERKNLEKLIAKYNLRNNVFLLGRIPQASKYLKAFDAFVLPSLKEGFPWVILEAMSAEIPIVATKVGAVPEILRDEESGLLVEPANSQKLAEKIKKLLENQDLGQKLAKKANLRLKDFSEQTMLEQTEKA